MPEKKRKNLQMNAMNERKLTFKELLRELNENDIEFNLITKQPQSELTEFVYLQNTHSNLNNS